MRSYLIGTAIAALTILTLPGLAAASEARASGDTPVRWGPGSGYDIIGYLEDGEYYEIEDCTHRAYWCLVSEGGYELGWVRGSYLIGSGAKTEATPFEFLVHPKFPFN